MSRKENLTEGFVGRRPAEMCDCPLHTTFPMRISDLVEPTLLDLQAGCDLIGKDSYGKPHWTPETIDPCNPVVQAFARHALAARSAMGAALADARRAIAEFDKEKGKK